jgi:hypothetical protein
MMGKMRGTSHETTDVTRMVRSVDWQLVTDKYRSYLQGRMVKVTLEDGIDRLSRNFIIIYQSTLRNNPDN